MRVLGISRFWVLFSFCGCVARGILFPSPETKWRPSAVNVDSPNLRTVREFPPYVYVFKFYCLYLEREGREKHYIIFVVVSHSLSHSVLSDSLWPHGLQHTRLPCPSPSPTVCPSSCPLNRWCCPTISSLSTCSYIVFMDKEEFGYLSAVSEIYISMRRKGPKVLCLMYFLQHHLRWAQII